ncbi:chemotaxis protein [Herbaspirillum sp. alder98]|uniref:chemotaxis protein n=1 Tax=Herbaspirillum sp. alder98 TaxID=2913096 RepID=UPI001CD86EAE|nr:chemotaxis protein [Herbaspirillum sp. alder98]MCA1325311.1 chemotaxis protein [Herbaspirillum sp. alder98]
MKSLRHVLPVLCVLNLLLFMMLAGRWWLGALVGLFIGGAFYLTCLPAPAQAKEDSPKDAPDGLAALLHQVLPVWRGHVELARTQTQSAIDTLTTRFAGINERLGRSRQLSQDARSAELQQLLQGAGEQLGVLAKALESVLASRQSLQGKLEGLAAANDEIRQLALQNEQLAGQTGVSDLLSSQQSWQELAERAAANSRQIVLRTKAARQQIQAAVMAAADLPDGADGIVEHSHAAIDRVLAGFGQAATTLANTVDQMAAENRAVDQEVSDILVNLQFQDRISQILAQLQGDIVRLQDSAPAAALPSPQQWLAELEKTYTTPEQRQVHAGGGARPTLQSQVDFF